MRFSGYGDPSSGWCHLSPGVVISAIKIRRLVINHQTPDALAGDSLVIHKVVISVIKTRLVIFSPDTRCSGDISGLVMLW